MAAQYKKFFVILCENYYISMGLILTHFEDIAETQNCWVYKTVLCGCYHLCSDCISLFTYAADWLDDFVTEACLTCLIELWLHHCVLFQPTNNRIFELITGIDVIGLAVFTWHHFPWLFLSGKHREVDFKRWTQSKLCCPHTEWTWEYKRQHILFYNKQDSVPAFQEVILSSS